MIVASQGQGLNQSIKAIWWLALLLGLARLAIAADTVGLIWNASTSAGVDKYRIRYGNLPGIYHSQSQVPPRDLNALITNLAYGTWYFVASAVLTNGLESEPSNEVAWTNRVFVPINLRITPPLDALLVQTSVDGIRWATVAIITRTNPIPIQLVMQPRQMIRTISTNLPPVPK